MATQTLKVYTKAQADARMALRTPVIWVLGAAEARPTTGGPTGNGVQPGDIIFRKPT